MTSYWEQNLEVLLEWDPVLAGRLLASGTQPPIPDPPCSCRPGTADYLLGRLEAGRTPVMLGLGCELWLLRARVTGPLWIVEPELDCLRRLMVDMPLLPLLLNGRLLVGTSPEETVEALARLGQLTLIPLTERVRRQQAFFTTLLGSLKRRALQGRETAARNLPAHLAAGVAEHDHLQTVLAQLPPGTPLTLEALTRTLAVGPEPLSWGERIILTMQSFR